MGEALVICSAMRGIVRGSDLAETWNAAFALRPQAADAIDFRRFGLTPEHRLRWGVDSAALSGKVDTWSLECRLEAVNDCGGCRSGMYRRA